MVNLKNNMLNQIVQVPINDLKACEYNPRKMNKQQAKDLEDSIKKFGLIDPILVNENPDRKNIVIGGHQRLETAKKLNYKTVSVIYLNLSLEKERELNVRLNKNTGSWDWDLLTSFDMKELENIGFNKPQLNYHFDIDKPKYVKCDKCGSSVPEKKIKKGIWQKN